MDTATALLPAVGAVVGAGAIQLGAPHGMPLSHHMLNHLIWMNIAAPAVAWYIVPVAGPTWARAQVLATATALQIAVLWGWHAPPVLAATLASPLLASVMTASLFLVATAFWTTTFAQRGDARWRAIVALLITGKLYCLLGALLIFAPRMLFAGDELSTIADQPITLADQHLAGLLMVGACPLTYVLAGIAISARWYFALEQAGGSAPQQRGFAKLERP